MAPQRRLFPQSRLNEVQLKALAQATSDIIFVTDRRGHIKAFHPSFSPAAGSGWEHFRGDGWRNAIHPDDRGKISADLLNESVSLSADLRICVANSTDWRWFRLRLVPLSGSGGAVREWVGSLTDIHEGVQAREARELLLGELRHRTKNLMTIIEALAKSSRRGREPVVDEFLDRFLGRLHALGVAGDMVLAGGRKFIEMNAMIRATLAPFMDEENNRILIDGPALQLCEHTGGGMALAVHELATNAIKYGALSVPDGKVFPNWSARPDDEGEAVAFEWRESGGPVPTVPEKSGFGMRVITAAPLREKSGKVAIEYRPEGLYCRISFVKAAAA